MKGICAVILAAGESRRYGAENKLLVELDGVAVLERVVRAITASGVERTLVITGADHDKIVSLMNGYRAECMRNPNWKEGMGRSLAFGVEQIQEEAWEGVMICLGDLPYLDESTVVQVQEHFSKFEGSRIIVPQHKGRRGHPIVFPASCMKSLTQLRGDEGARSVIVENEESLVNLQVETKGIYQDLDRPEDLG